MLGLPHYVTLRKTLNLVGLLTPLLIPVYSSLVITHSSMVPGELRISLKQDFLTKHPAQYLAHSMSSKISSLTDCPLLTFFLSLSLSFAYRVICLNLLLFVFTTLSDNKEDE